MRARQLITNSHGPETLSGVFVAFDSAWEEIAPEVGNYPVAIEAARMKLASIVLAVASEGSRDPALIKASALKIFALAHERPRAK